MESQPQNPELRNNPENFHPCVIPILWKLCRCFCLKMWRVLMVWNVCEWGGGGGAVFNAKI